MQVKRINYKNENLWCIYSKEKIEIGEEYILLIEYCYSERLEKCYKLEYKDFIDEEE